MELIPYYDVELDIMRGLSESELIDLCDVEEFEDGDDYDEYYD